MFDAIVFAGGGNRCYWQGGFYEAIADRLALAPKLTVGASAGAFAGIYSLLGLGHKVRAQVIPACGPHRKNFDFAAWRRGEALCPVGPMFKQAVLSKVESVEGVKNATVDITFNPPWDPRTMASEDVKLALGIW